MTIFRRVFTPLAWLALHIAGWSISRLGAGIGEDRWSDPDEEEE